MLALRVTASSVPSGPLTGSTTSSPPATVELLRDGGSLNELEHDLTTINTERTWQGSVSHGVVRFWT